MYVRITDFYYDKKKIKKVLYIIDTKRRKSLECP